MLLIPLLLIPILAILANYVLFTGVDTPDAAFGSGNMFDTIAPRYDLVNRAMALRMDIGWRQRLVHDVLERVPKNEAHLLDMATGTCDVALMLSQYSTATTTTILGVDPSQNMLSIGQDKITASHQEDRIQLQHGAVEDLVNLLDESSMDGATMAFGIRNVVDRNHGLCQIHRVLKKGAVLGILELSEPTYAEFGILGYAAQLFIRYIAPVAGAILSGKPQEYLHLQNSIQHFPAPTEFGEMMENLDCPHDLTQGTFRLEKLQHMNFGSVQLYVATAMK